MKEYQTKAGQGVTVQLSGVEINLATGEQKVDPPRPPIYHYTMNTGVFAGLDQRKLIERTIDWWEEQLNEIDKAAVEV